MSDVTSKDRTAIAYERSGRGPLARVHRLDARAEYLRDVRGVGEHQRDGAEQRGARRDPLQPQRRHAEADQVEHDQQGQAAEEVRVGSGDDAHGQEDRTP